MHVCVPVCAATKVVRSVKRKESDQRGDKTMEGARQRRGVVGGTGGAAEAVCTLYLYCFALFLWRYFSFMISSPFFSFFFCSCTHPPTHQRSAPFRAAPASTERSHKRGGHTAPRSQLSFRSLQKRRVQSDAAAAAPPLLPRLLAFPD